MMLRSSSVFFFFNDTATTEIYTLSLHDALPSSARMSTATDSSCSDSSTLSGRPGVPVMRRCTSSSWAQHHHARWFRVRQRPDRVSGTGRALDGYLQAGTVFREPPLAPCRGDHPVPLT